MKDNLSPNDLMGDIFVSNRSGEFVRAVGSLDIGVRMAESKIQNGRGRHPVVEVTFPYYVMNLKTVDPKPSDVPEKGWSRVLFRIARGHCVIRGKCIASTAQRACVAFDPKVVTKMREEGVRVARVGGIVSMFTLDSDLYQSTLFAESILLPETAIVTAARVKVIKRKGREPTTREMALAKATGTEILRRRSRPFRAWFPVAKTAKEAPRPKG